MPGYKLVYFPVRGRAQALRYICADNGITLEEQVVAMNEWGALKPKTPLGQLPVFYDGDFVLAQSNAILRYVAKKHGLYGKDDKEAALIDMINDQQEDVRLTYINLIYRNYEAGKADYVKSIPDNLKVLETVLSRNHGGDGFFIGDKISFADYTIFDLLDNLVTLSSTCLDTLPLLKGFYTRMGNREKIAKLRSTEAFKKTPINGNGKQ